MAETVHLQVKYLLNLQMSSAQGKSPTLWLRSYITQVPAAIFNLLEVQ